MTEPEVAPASGTSDTSNSAPGIVTAGFVLSLLGFICGLPAVLGLIFGIVGLPRAKKAQRGVGLAIASIVISSAWILATLVVTVALLSTDTTGSDNQTSDGGSTSSQPTSEEATEGDSGATAGDAETDSPCEIVDLQTYTIDSMDEGLVYLKGALFIENTSSDNHDFRARYQVQDLTQSKVVGEVVWDGVIPASTTLPLPVISAEQVSEDSEIELVQQSSSCEPTKKKVFFADIKWEDPDAVCAFGDEPGKAGCPLATITNDTEATVTIDRTYYVHFDQDGNVVRVDNNYPSISGTDEIPPGFSMDVPVGGGDLKGAVRIEAWGQT